MQSCRWSGASWCSALLSGAVRNLCPTSKKTTVLWTQEFHMMAKIGLNEMGRKQIFACLRLYSFWSYSCLVPDFCRQTCKQARLLMLYRIFADWCPAVWTAEIGTLVCKTFNNNNTYNRHRVVFRSDRISSFYIVSKKWSNLKLEYFYMHLNFRWSGDN